MSISDSNAIASLITREIIVTGTPLQEVIALIANQKISVVTTSQNIVASLSSSLPA